MLHCYTAAAGWDDLMWRSCKARRGAEVRHLGNSTCLQWGAAGRWLWLRTRWRTLSFWGCRQKEEDLVSLSNLTKCQHFIQNSIFIHIIINAFACWDFIKASFLFLNFTPSGSHGKKSLKESIFKSAWLILHQNAAFHELRSARANDGGSVMRKTDGTLWTSADIRVPVKAASTRPTTKFPDRKHAVLWWVTRTHSCILQHKYTVCTCDLKSVWTDSGRCDVSVVALQHHAEFAPHNLDCLHRVFRCPVTAPAWINMSASACAADFGAKFSAEVCSRTSGVAKQQQKKSCKREGGYAKQIFQKRGCRSWAQGQRHSYRTHKRKL